MFHAISGDALKMSPNPAWSLLTVSMLSTVMQICSLQRSDSSDKLNFMPLYHPKRCLRCCHDPSADAQKWIPMNPQIDSLKWGYSPKWAIETIHHCNSPEASDQIQTTNITVQTLLITRFPETYVPSVYPDHDEYTIRLATEGAWGRKSPNSHKPTIIWPISFPEPLLPTYQQKWQAFKVHPERVMNERTDMNSQKCVPPQGTHNEWT